MSKKVVKLVSGDMGSVSVKTKSDDARGSLFSVAASVPPDAMDEFRTFASNKPLNASYDLRVLSDVGWQRWFVGMRAESSAQARWITRDMRRFDDEIYRVLLCGLLRTAFPETGRPEDDLLKRREKPHGSWRQPVRMVLSIAPAYFGNAGNLIKKITDHPTFDLVDRRTHEYFGFEVVGLRVVPESFGGYAQRMYSVNNRGKLAWRRSTKDYRHETVLALDSGGRTFDFMGWRDGDIVEKFIGSADLGIYDYVRATITEIMARLTEHFPEQPTRMEVLDAIIQRRTLSDPVHLKGYRGKPVDITDIVDRNMNMFASDFLKVFEDSLRGGQGVGAFLYMGGGLPILYRYLMRFTHDKPLFEDEIWVANPDKIEDIWMANADGGYLWGRTQFSMDAE